MSECELGEVKRTPRGFQYVEFLDRNDVDCGLQQSSAIGEYDDAMDRPGSSFVWLGPNHMTEQTRMHLSRTDVAALIETLGRWLDRGTFICDDEVTKDA